MWHANQVFPHSIGMPHGNTHTLYLHYTHIDVSYFDILFGLYHIPMHCTSDASGQECPVVHAYKQSNVSYNPIHLHTFKASLIRRRHAFTCAMQRVLKSLRGSTTKGMLCLYAPTGFKTTSNVDWAYKHHALLFIHLPHLDSMGMAALQRTKHTQIYWEVQSNNHWCCTCNE